MDRINRLKPLLALAMFAVALTLLPACSAGSMESLYSLPEMSDEYLQLQKLIDAEISGGCEYSAPVSGNHRQSIQLHDITGDGVKEGIVFFRQSDLSLKVCIYRFLGDECTLTATILGDGSSFGSVNFADMDGNGADELVIAWQISPDMRIVTVYSLVNWNASVVMSADCSQYILSDMDQDKKYELITLRFPDAGVAYADMYCLASDGEVENSSAKLSDGISAFNGMTAGSLSNGGGAVFAESLLTNEMTVIDVLSVSDGKLKCVSTDPDTGVNALTTEYSISCSDIDGDGVTEVPVATKLYSQSETSSAYWILDWYEYDRFGRAHFKLSTYHCYSDSWYLVLPENLRENLTVRRESGFTGERIVVLSTVDGGEVTDRVMIYTLTGDNRYDRAKLAGRFTLRVERSTVYAARILDGFVTQEELLSSFNLIYSQWTAG